LCVPNNTSSIGGIQCISESGEGFPLLVKVKIIHALHIIRSLKDEKEDRRRKKERRKKEEEEKEERKEEERDKMTKKENPEMKARSPTASSVIFPPYLTNGSD